MRRLVIIAVIFTALAGSVSAEIDRERQIEIIENYMWVTGQLDQMPDKMAASLTLPGEDQPHPIKCGMSYVLDFKLNYDQFDKDLLRRYAASLPSRPNRANTYDSPGGYFKIHYNRLGDHAVYRATDTNTAGVPLYVVSTARIFDSVYVYFRDTLNYRMPVSDGFYGGGGDSLYDVYLSNVGAFGVYGLTYLDSAYLRTPDEARATSFIEIDNDYQGPAFLTYNDNPLNAVRVTAAHEFFHAVHFEYDYLEHETTTDGIVRRYWMEMSAVWMEEEQYDEINDYYLILPFFYNDPRLSLQQFNAISDLRPYASGIFPLFMVEFFDTYPQFADSLDGRDLIRKIWEHCDTLNVGPSFLLAAHNVLLEQTDFTQNLATAFREFALWNLFTGDRADPLPYNLQGYEERANYPQFPDNLLGLFTEFDFLLTRDTSIYNPEHLGAAYFKLDQTQAVVGDDTTYWVSAQDWIDSTGSDTYVDTTCWVCRAGTYPLCNLRTTDDWLTAADCDSLSFDSTVCTDSCQIREITNAPFDSIWSDTSSVLELGIGLDPEFIDPWGLSVVLQYADKLDSLEVARLLLPPGQVTGLLDLGVPATGKYRSITLILSPAAPNREYYSYNSTIETRFGLNLLVSDSADEARYDFNVDSTAINVPPAILSAYPNPAVLTDMTEKKVTFRFQIPTDELSMPLYFSPFMALDLYTVAGERILSMDSTVDASPGNLFVPTEQEVIAEISWDMTNAFGTDVASGVYLGVARLFESRNRQNILAEETVKVLIIR